ncbi:MAG: MoaD/ThiS family protein [Chloroflexi bacterium]|nr:MoaD/ThiS family protein [Chloroflexota bacterium]
MARVFIPQPLRKQAGGRIDIQIPGKNLREVIENLEKEIPGAAKYILQDGELKPGLAAIVGEQATRQGLLHKIEDDETEVHFLPAIAGG